VKPVLESTLDDETFHRTLEQLVELCMRECFTDKYLWKYERFQCALVGCSNSLKGKRFDSRYCSEQHKNADYARRRRKIIADLVPLDRSHDDTPRMQPLRRDRLVTYASINVTMPKRLKLRLYRQAHTLGVSQERLVNTILERELPAYQKWSRNAGR
jgi:hypothetical protein